MQDNTLEHYSWPENYGDPSWFVRDRFGLFIHFGLYAIPARHEWVMTLEKISQTDYAKYFERFNPDLIDVKQWAKQAKATGCRYVVITTKHHDGFCLWNSASTDFNVMNTPYGKDLLAEVVEAFRAEGLKIGFYYSLLDWKHPDFPVDGYHPHREDADYIAKHSGNMTAYAAFMRAQITELLTQYGKIDYLWFDFSYADRDWGEFKGKGKEQWESEVLEELILRLQPEILLNDRLGLQRGVSTPEQYQRAKRNDPSDQKRLWEACQTLNGSWGYDRDNQDWKSAEMILRMLIDTVSKGGNMLLNVGPNARGEWNAPTQERLDTIAHWFKYHQASIHGCGESQFEPPTDCRYTQNGNRLYLHLFAYPYRTLLLPDLGGKVKFARFLHDGSEIRFQETANLSGKRQATKDLYGEIKQVNIKENLGKESIVINLPIQRPQVLIPVIELELD